jgi:hypothetical protein
MNRDDLHGSLALGLGAAVFFSTIRLIVGFDVPLCSLTSKKRPVLRLFGKKTNN